LFGEDDMDKGVDELKFQFGNVLIWKFENGRIDGF